MTKTEAIKKAGYADSTAHQQTDVLGNTRNIEQLQESLRQNGLDEGEIGKQLAKDTKKLKPGRTKLGYLSAAAKFLDAVPSDKVDKNVNLSGRLSLAALVDETDSADADDEK